MRQLTPPALCALLLAMPGACSEPEQNTPPPENLGGSSLWPEATSPERMPPPDEENPWTLGTGASSGRMTPENSPAPGDPDEQPSRNESTSSNGQESGQKDTELRSEPPPPDDNQHEASNPDSPDQKETSPPRLLLVRYREGQGTDKLLEIKNLGDQVTQTCVVDVFSNGRDTSWRSLALPETIDQGKSVVLCTEQAPESDGECDVLMSGSPYNGNDALVLRCGDTVIDSLGQSAFDPGTQWHSSTNPNLRTQDAELVRCDPEADTDPSDPFELDGHWTPVDPETPETIPSICPNEGGGLGGSASTLGP